MKPKHLLIVIPLLFVIQFICHPVANNLVFGQEPPAAEAPAEKVEAPAPVPAEAPAEKAEEPAKEETKDDTASNIWNPSWWEIIGAILALIWGIIVTKTKMKEGKKKKIVEAFEAAVQDTYTEFVRELKAGKEDGKLTKDEVKKAQGMAWDKAKGILQSQGIELGKEVAAEYGPVLVTKLVQLFKKDKKD